MSRKTIRSFWLLRFNNLGLIDSTVNACLVAAPLIVYVKPGSGGILELQAKFSNNGSRSWESCLPMEGQATPTTQLKLVSIEGELVAIGHWTFPAAKSSRVTFNKVPPGTYILLVEEEFDPNVFAKPRPK